MERVIYMLCCIRDNYFLMSIFYKNGNFLLNIYMLCCIRNNYFLMSIFYKNGNFLLNTNFYVRFHAPSFLLQAKHVSICQDLPPDGHINERSPSPMRFCCMKGETSDDVSWPLFRSALLIVSALNMHDSRITSFSG